VAASAVELQRDGEPSRLKSCGNPDCSWIFYDNTINHSRRFWTQVQQVCPDFRTAEKWLRANGRMLF